jgi:hypothetical protein
MVELARKCSKPAGQRLQFLQYGTPPGLVLLCEFHDVMQQFFVSPLKGVGQRLDETAVILGDLLHVGTHLFDLLNQSAHLFPLDIQSCPISDRDAAF